MPVSHNFKHLPLILRYEGLAKLQGGGEIDPQTEANKSNRKEHSARLQQQSQSQVEAWERQQRRRQAEGLPIMPNSIPLILQIDQNLDSDRLRHHFNFEILGEESDGHIIAALADEDIKLFQEQVVGFASAVRGSATIASIHDVHGPDQQLNRLDRILSSRLRQEWSMIAEEQLYIVDIGISCIGTAEIPNKPERGKEEAEESWQRKISSWERKRQEAIESRDAIKEEREIYIYGMLPTYTAEMLSCKELPFDAGVLPDSFTIRLRISGKGLKDFALNYPFIFEITEPEDVDLPQSATRGDVAALGRFTPIEPEISAPAVCVIDSGIQEGHPYLAPAIDAVNSHCFLPGFDTKDVADEVIPGGHGTRVAGAILYGEEIPSNGSVRLPFRIQNARILNADSGMPKEMFPPEVMRRTVEKYNIGDNPTRIFNHSVNTRGPCRMGFMSAWAAELDQLSYERDILFIQSAGNISARGTGNYLGIGEHIRGGRDYPEYLQEHSCRVSNPGHSLQALTVGSVAYGALQDSSWRTFATRAGEPSAFSRSGPGIWNVIKPEVVEYGGDMIRNENAPPDIASGGALADACPSLVRSTLHAPGPVVDCDATGTSFAAPKVARIAAHLQSVLPEQSSLLFRALIVQSAQWPEWAESLLQSFRESPKKIITQKKHEWRRSATVVMRSIGYGVPDLIRASSNTDHRVTLITEKDVEIKAGSGHIFQVPIPAVLRGQADEFEIRIDITLSYVAQPRRTRRGVHRYLSIWLDWKTSNLGESMDNFRVRALKNSIHEQAPIPGKTLPWTLQSQGQHGYIADFRRSDGTVQKDWAVVRSNSLPDDFCIAVVGHQGWSDDPDEMAKYSLAVTFEIIGQEVAIYEELLNSVEELEGQLSTVESEALIDIATDI